MVCYADQHARTAFSSLYNPPAVTVNQNSFGTITRLLCTPADYVPTKEEEEILDITIQVIV